MAQEAYREMMRARKRAAEEEEARIERDERRREALGRCLAGFKYEIGMSGEGEAYNVALRHPHEPAKWLAFAVEAFSGDGEPVLPLQAREIQIYAGRVAEYPVPLAIAAAEYITPEEE